ncbi:MAG: DUF1015 domain-containing protein [Phycisphaerae bacterium]
MADIEPFKAIRYSRTDLSDLAAPPYDILSQADKDALLARNEQNIVSIDLPHVPPKAAGPDEVYERAAGELVSWLDTHHLLRDPEPALYAYHQTYRLAGQTLTRKMFFVRLRLENFGEGRVFPHEQTFGGPKDDRLKLTRATRCNLSPIFGLYPDPGNGVAARLEEDIDREPDASALLDGVTSSLWVVTDADTLNAVKQRLADLPVYIADGHHRYATALNYRRTLLEETGDEPDPNAPYNYVLAVLSGMEDPGGTIQPYFRTIVDVPQVSAGALQRSLGNAFTLATIERPKNELDLAQRLAAAGSHAFALYVAQDDTCLTLIPKDPDLLARYEPDRHPAWRRLPYAVLHRYVIDEVLTPARGGAPPIHYHKALEETITDAHENAGLAALMPATTMAELRDVCAARELMPQKSTYFYPKLVTGLVINPLY